MTEGSSHSEHQVTPDEETEPLIGPALPPGFNLPKDDVLSPKDPSTKEDDEVFIGPALPPASVSSASTSAPASAAKAKKRVYGPTLEDLSQPYSSDSGSSSSSASESGSDDEGEEFGPLPPDAVSAAVRAAAEEADLKDEKERARLEKEKWSALRSERTGENSDTPVAKKTGHEEWMTSLPTEKHGFDPLVGRTFKKDGVTEIDKSWGKTPGTKSGCDDHDSPKKHRDKHSSHDKHEHHHHHHKHHKHKHSDDDDDDDKKAKKKKAKKEEKKKKQQPKSLLEEHLERMKSGEQPAKRARTASQQELTWRMPGTGSTAAATSGSAYWDRERDMATNHISRSTATSLLGRAESLSSRFRSSGTSNHFI